MIRKIGILTIASSDSGGIYQYTLSLIEAIKLYGNNDKYEYVQIRYPDFPKILDKDIVIDREKRNVLLKVKRVIHAYTSLALGKLIENIPERLSNLDLIISPVITLLPYHMKKPYVVTIHDFQQEYYPQFFTLKDRLIRKVIYRTGKFANIVVVESGYVKNDVIKFLGVDERRIRVLPSPPPSYISKISIEEKKLKEIKEKYRLPDRFIFYPAQFWFHKNHIKLLQSIYLVRQKYNIVIYLILVGSRHNNFDNVMRKIEELDLSQSVKYLGYVPDQDMPYLYKLSFALVMPTLFESVSIPIWEAFYLGVPVVSSNVCALPEQVGDAGLLFDPNNVEDMAEKVYRIWTDEALREKLIEKGYERIKNLTIENYAKEWEKIIDEISIGGLI